MLSSAPVSAPVNAPFNPSVSGPNSAPWSWSNMLHSAPPSGRINTPVAGPVPATVHGACPPLELIFARGTGEMPGFGIVGTPLLNALQTRFHGASGYAVDYRAGTAILSSAADGSVKALSHLKARAGECPNTKFVLGGYSQ